MWSRGSGRRSVTHPQRLFAPTHWVTTVSTHCRLSVVTGVHPVLVGSLWGTGVPTLVLPLWDSWWTSTGPVGLGTFPCFSPPENKVGVETPLNSVLLIDLDRTLDP